MQQHRRHARFLLLLGGLVCAGLSLPSSAQDTAEPLKGPIDGAKISYEYLPASGLGDDQYPEAEAEVQEFKMRFAVPVFLHEGRTIIVNNFAYRNVRINLKNWDPANGYVPDELHGMTYTLGLRRKLSETSKLLVAFRPGLVSDLENIDSDHYRYDGVIIYSRQSSRTFRWHLGIGFGDDLGDPRVLPILRFQWVKERYRAEIFVPKRVLIYYTPSRRYEVGLQLLVIGNHFRIGAEESPEPKASLKYRRFAIGPVANFQLKGPIYLTVAGGLVFGRTAELRDFDGNDILTRDSDNVAFLRCGLMFRIW